MENERIEALRQAAENGEAEAMYQLAMLYWYGEGVTEDSVLAAQLLEKAAEKGNVEATYRLAQCYNLGKGVDTDFKRACMLYWTSAQCGCGKGMVMLARFYEKGIGVEQNYDQAIKWYLQATETDDRDASADAWYAMGDMCRTGRGVKKDEEEAKKYFAVAHNVRMLPRYKKG